MSESLPLYGVMAEFGNTNDFVAAVHAVQKAGYQSYDAYSPMPVEEAIHAMDLPRNPLPLMVLCGGIAGFCFGYFLAYWTGVINYPINIGGRPLHSWPAYIPVLFECTVLFAALTAVFGMLGLNGFPQPYHPVFNVPRFAMATRDRFFVCIEATDPKFDLEETKRFLQALTPVEVSEVES